jgi:hypothetical protein
MSKDHKAFDLNALEDAVSSRLSLNGIKHKCAFAKLVERLGPEAKQLTESLMANKKVSTRAIHSALRKAGAHIGRDTITDHRNHDCICNAVALGDPDES